MNVLDFFKNKVFKLRKLIRLSNNPNSERLTYINDDEAIRINNIRTNKVWYMGNGDELLNWYTNQQTYGWAANPIYNRNKRQFFWGMSINEMVKRVHSGIPKAIVDTLSNIVGMPDITGDDRLNDIFEANDFEFMLTQRTRPMVLVEGDGCWKVNVNEKLSKHPIIEYYGAEDWAPIYRCNVLLGVIFKSYYKDKDNKDLILFETRTLRPEGLAIEYQLYRLGKNDELTPISLDTVPELSGLQNSLIENSNCLMAVPVKYYFDPLRPERGKSIYDGKLDLFDFMDEILTQASQTNRVSTPVEYYPVDLLKRTKNGIPILPKRYDRQYVQVEATLDGDGSTKSEIQTTQPDLNFDKYGGLLSDVLSDVLIGIMSPSSLGLDIQKRDNADAQREKEKQTIFTRTTIISCETKALVKLCKILLMTQRYMETGIFKEEDFQISVKYDEFANPSFESELQILGPAWANGEISTERFVAMLWAGKMSDEEMTREVAWLDENKQKDDFDMGALLNGPEEGNKPGIPGAGEEEEAPQIPEE